MSVTGYIYKITELSSLKIYIGFKRGSFDVNYFGSPKKTSQLFQRYQEIGIVGVGKQKEEKLRIFLEHFRIEVIEESNSCDEAPEWAIDKTLTLEGAYKVYKYPECLNPLTGFNRNIDRVNSFPFLINCNECLAQIGSHKGNCSKAKVCQLCDGRSGKHKASCEKKKCCVECGATNQFHSKDLGEGVSCSRYDPSFSEASSALRKKLAKTDTHKEQFSRAGRANKGTSKPEAWKKERSKAFTENNPMKNEATRAKMRASKSKPKFSIICPTCNGAFLVTEGQLRGGRIYCSRKCYVARPKVKLPEESNDIVNPDSKQDVAA